MAPKALPYASILLILSSLLVTCIFWSSEPTRPAATTTNVIARTVVAADAVSPPVRTEPTVPVPEATPAVHPPAPPAHPDESLPPGRPGTASVHALPEPRLPSCGSFPGGTARETLKYLTQLQFPTDCSSRRLLVFRMPHEGMFATFDQIVAALSYAMCQDRTLVIDNHREWMYAPRVNCTLNGVYEPWACWFRQLSACKAPAEYPKVENTYCSRGHWKDKVMIMTAEWEGVRAKQNVHCFGEYYPTGFMHKATLTSFLLQPSPTSEHFMSSQMQRLKAQGLGHPFIALHMRATDKCKPWRKDPNDRHCYTYQEHYRPLLQQAAAVLGSHQVLLVTDNATLREQLPKSETQFQLFTVRAMPTAQPPPEGAVPFLKALFKTGQPLMPSQGFDVAAHSLSFIAELCMMANADWFVGTYSSNVGRRVIELMGVKRNTGNWSSYSHSVDVSERMWDSKYKR